MLNCGLYLHHLINLHFPFQVGTISGYHVGEQISGRVLDVGSARDADDFSIIFWCVPVFVGEATTKINSTASYGIECLPSAVVPHLEND